MHDTAYEHGRMFFELYCSDGFDRVLDLGSQDVNGSLRDLCPVGTRYIGLDTMAAKGVDVVVSPNEVLPIASESIDAVVTTSAFEHDICFWDTFLELVRVLRAGGLIYINAPSNHAFHRYPLDCWRFYPDAGVALVRWAERRGSAIDLIESFIAQPRQDGWADFVAVFRKPGGRDLTRKGRIADHAQARNIYDVGMQGGAALRAETATMPDMQIAAGLKADLDAGQTERQAAARTKSILSKDLSAARSRAEALGLEAQTSAVRIAQLEFALAETASQLRIAKETIEAIYKSTSWRLTAGLRWLMLNLRR